MIKESAFKKFALVFGILCSIALIVCLCISIELPTKTVYNTVFGTVTSTTPGYFNIDYLSAIIILALGAYIGFWFFACIKTEDKKVKKVKKECRIKDVNTLEQASEESVETENDDNV